MSLANAMWLVGLAALPMTAHALDGQDAPAKVAPKNDAGRADAAALVKQLGDPDYAARKEAYRKLEKLGTAARAELEKASKSDDAEVRWSASLLLDRLDGGDRQDFQGRDDATPAPVPGEKTVRRGGARE